jgi:hypothetical protein
LSAFLSFELRFLDRTVLERATNGALDPIERLGQESYFACLNLRDRTRIQSATRRQFVLANPEKCSFSPDVCAQRLPQRIFHDALRLR